MGLLSALVIASSALQVGSQIASARGARRAANDAVNEGNRLAADARARGEQEVARYQIKLDQVLGRQRAGFAAAGIDATSGSAAQITRETERFGAQDVQTIRDNAMREAFSLKRQGQSYARQARAQATAAYGQAFATTLSAGARGWELYSQGRTGRANAAVSSMFRSDPAVFG